MSLIFIRTIQYASPEILAAKRYSGPKAEIWALGCCLYIMLTGQVPFSNARQAMHLGMNRPKFPISDTCLDLLFIMLQKDPQSRATMREVLEHPWIKNAS